MLSKTGKKLKTTTLTHNKIWKGNENNEPVESEIEVGNNDATYILQKPDENLINAQSLNALTSGILKSTTATGAISIASGGKTPEINDYVRPIDLQEEIEGVIAEATEAGASAGAEAGATTGATAGTEAGTIAGGSAGATAGTASGTAAATLVLLSKESKSDHNSDMDKVNKRIDDITKQVIKPQRIEGFPNNKSVFLAGNGKWLDPINHQTLLLEYKKNKVSIAAMDNKLEGSNQFVRNAEASSVIEASHSAESSAIVMNTSYIQLISNFNNLGVVYSDSDVSTFHHYISYISSNGNSIINSTYTDMYSLKLKGEKNYLSKLNQIKIYDFAYKVWFDDKDTVEQKTRKYYKSKQHVMGIIGEQLVKIFPDATDNFTTIEFNENNKKEIPKKVWNYKPEISEKEYIDKKNNQRFGQTGINYNNLLCYTILALQELTKKVESLENKINKSKTC